MAGYFAGIKVPAATAQSVRASMPLGETAGRIHWTTTGNMHSTLKYYGGIPGMHVTHDEYRETIIKEWKERALLVQPFSLTLHTPYWYLEYFCADLAGGIDEWRTLAIGTKPHVTLGRSRSDDPGFLAKNRKLTKRNLSADWQSEEFKVSAVYLYYSRNRNYETVHRFNLGG